MQTIDLLIVDDDDEYRATVARRFARRGYRIAEAAEGEAALALAAGRQFHVAVVDLVMPGLSGLDLLEKLKAGSPDCEVVMLTGQGTIETAVEAMKRGAFDFLTKPFPLAELEVVVQKAFDHRQLRQENRQLKAVLARSQPTCEMTGRSPAMQEVCRLIERAGPTDKA
ncbi:MAG: response regulator, partial [Candidatus Saccharimonadales bacterium]